MAKALKSGQNVWVSYEGEDMPAKFIGKRDGLWWVRTHGGIGRAIGMHKRRDIRLVPRFGRVTNPARLVMGKWVKSKATRVVRRGGKIVVEVKR